MAQLVQYVPLPVVGGYLGYVGYFCVAGGTSLAAGVEVRREASHCSLVLSSSSPLLRNLKSLGTFCSMQLNKVAQWLDILHLDPFIKIVPLIITTVILILTMEHFTHPLVLPGVLAAIPLVFHGVLLAAGWTLEQAQETGWAMKPTVSHGTRLPGSS